MNVLKEGDQHSAVWKQIKQYIEKRLETLRLKNDGDLTEIETAKLRGRILELKALAELDNPAPQIEADAHLL